MKQTHIRILIFSKEDSFFVAKNTKYNDAISLGFGTQEEVTESFETAEKIS